jgi:hypothetical protein
MTQTVPRANPYVATVSFSDGRRESVTVYAYTASDAAYQSIVDLSARAGDPTGMKFESLGPPRYCWNVDGDAAAAVGRILSALSAESQAGDVP